MSISGEIHTDVEPSVYTVQTELVCTQGHRFKTGDKVFLRGINFYCPICGRPLAKQPKSTSDYLSIMKFFKK